MTPTEHLDTRHRFIKQAVAEHADGDLLQASEKTWGAAAHSVKSIAGRRGWRHDTHRLLFIAVDRILFETGQREIRRLFQIASDAHKNFYQGSMDSREVEQNILEVERLPVVLETIR